MMEQALAFISIAAGLGLMTCAVVCLAVAARPDEFLESKRTSLILRPLSQLLPPRLGEAAACRIVGLAIAILAFAAALPCLVYFPIVYFAHEGN